MEVVRHLRASLRPVKRGIVRPRLERTLRSRDWERKWRHENGLDWQPGEVAPEIADAYESGWLGHQGRLLDVGCGSGGSSAWLSARGFAVLGIDVSPTAIARAQTEHPRKDGLSFAVDDVSVRNSRNGQVFDVVIDRGCLHGLPDRLQQIYAENVTEWMATGGRFLLIMHAQSADKTAERLELASRLFSESFAIESHDRVDALAHRHGKVLSGVAIRLRRN